MTYLVCHGNGESDTPSAMANITHARTTVLSGIAPEHDGVTLIVNPGEADEVIVVFPAEAAAETGTELNFWGIEAIRRAFAAIARHSANEAKNSILVRVEDDPSRMDS